MKNHQRIFRKNAGNESLSNKTMLLPGKFALSISNQSNDIKHKIFFDKNDKEITEFSTFHKVYLRNLKMLFLFVAMAHKSSANTH